MTYSCATDSYQNDFLEKILDTDFRFDVPYKIDRKKYEEVVKKYNFELRIKDADVVTFRCDFDREDNEDENSPIKGKTFYTWNENSPEGSDDFYDCFQFRDWYKEEEHHIEHFEEFVHDLLETVISPDRIYIMKLEVNLKEKRKQTNKEIRIVNKILSKL